MKLRTIRTLALALGLTAAGFSVAQAAPKTYQVTGQVLEATDSTITVETVKGNEKWQIERESGTKSKGDAVKVGDKVTIEYRMTATSIENKGPAKAEKGAKADKADMKADSKADKAAAKADKAAEKADKAAEKAEKAADKAAAPKK